MAARCFFASDSVPFSSPPPLLRVCCGARPTLSFRPVKLFPHPLINFVVRQSYHPSWPVSLFQSPVNSLLLLARLLPPLRESLPVVALVNSVAFPRPSNSESDRTFPCVFRKYPPPPFRRCFEDLRCPFNPLFLSYFFHGSLCFIRCGIPGLPFSGPFDDQDHPLLSRSFRFLHKNLRLKRFRVFL